MKEIKGHELRMRLAAMTKRRRGARWAVLGLAVLYISAGSLAQSGPEFSRLSIPLPIEIDGRPKPSKIYLKVEMKSYNQPFDQFAVGHPDKAEAMFVKAVQAVRKNDVAAFSSVWTAPDEMKSTGQTKVVKMSDNGPDGWMKLIRGMFDFDKLTVVAEVLAGPDTMFIWDSQTKNGVLRRSMYVGLDKNGNLRLSAPGGTNPVDDLLQNAFVAAQTDPDSYKPLPNINLRYQYPIPLQGASSGAHPVFLVFDGSPMDFPVTDEKTEAPSPLLKTYRAAALANRNGMDDQYSASFTPKSAEKVKEWQAEKAEIEKRRESEPKNLVVKPPAPPAVPSSAPPSTMIPKVPVLSKGPQVKFVLNADPVYLVFQALGPGTDWAPTHLSYTYVVSESGTFENANFGYGNTLDQLLQNPALFDNRFLKPAPAKPVTKPVVPKPKAPTASVKPAGAKQ